MEHGAMQKEYSFDKIDPLLRSGRYRQLAKATGFSRQHISRVLRGITSPSSKCIEEMARVCCLTVDEIIWYIRYSPADE
jgi:transcriptional regulator with XRE-family HTH domain